MRYILNLEKLIPPLKKKKKGERKKEGEYKHRIKDSRNRGNRRHTYLTRQGREQQRLESPTVDRIMTEDYTKPPVNGPPTQEGGQRGRVIGEGGGGVWGIAEKSNTSVSATSSG